MEEIQRIMGETQKRYNEEYKSPKLNIVTAEKNITGDGCDGGDRVTVMKYYTVKNREDYEKGNYERHYGEVYSTGTYTVMPRKFYNEAQVWAFLEHIERRAGRTLEDAEKMLMLRTITKGRRYELVCIIDRTKEFERETMYKDYKKER